MQKTILILTNQPRYSIKAVESKKQRSQLILLYIIFIFSGFAGLIYESIWSHYLKLFLGHAAYAQTLVLAIFMGGMAIGAWITSKYSTRWKNLFLAYALVECIVGIAALFFHTVFDQSIQYAYSQIIPELSSVLGVTIFKWSLSSALILPQSILLGMTFPLMSAGIIRRFPEKPGSQIAMLYFSNSIGAAFGVIVGGFFLIDLVGLPGTIKTAGIINIFLAVIVWQLVKNHQANEPKIIHKKSSNIKPEFYITLCVVALLTGAASFIYEISWIRMLSLVLGSSTHAFELMLSAFILGLALGGLWIKRRIDSLPNSTLTLANIQIMMGILALLTLPLYGNTFEIMQWILGVIPKTNFGYSLFNLSSQAIAVMIMLPTTFLAGMTLPIITYSLIKEGGGEKSIGIVYAANTLGAIIGIFFAIHIGLPTLGLKGLITFGASIDIILGIGLLIWISKTNGIEFPRVRTFAALLAIIATMLFVNLDSYKMASGVYRLGNLLSADEFDIIFHKDGKTATVDLTQGKDGVVGIRTNGKVDASINLIENGRHTADEATMVLAAAIPLALNPKATSAANIGLGSGLTTHTLLLSTSIQSVDTIEIEQAIVEAAEIFRPKTGLAFTSNKGKIHIDDAKTFFSNQKNKYDIIISEPSNPWVSGTANLFTSEFYQHVNNYLSQDGLLVQWIQLYEIDLNLVSSVFKALTNQFSDFEVYASNTSDILIIAKKEGKLPKLNPEIFNQTALAKELERIKIKNIQDLSIRKITSKNIIDPLLPTFRAPANSDYYPYLDLNAARARFLNLNALQLIKLIDFPLPIVDMLDNKLSTNTITKISADPYFPITGRTETAINFFNLLTMKNKTNDSKLPKHLAMYAQMAAPLIQECDANADSNFWLDTLFDNVALAIVPYLSSNELSVIWKYFDTESCQKNLTNVQKQWLTLFKAISNKNATEMAKTASALLSSRNEIAGLKLATKKREYLLGAGMLGYLAMGNKAQAQQLWNENKQSIYNNSEPGFAMKLLLAHAKYSI